MNTTHTSYVIETDDKPIKKADLAFSIFTRTQTRLIVKVDQATRGFSMLIGAALFIAHNQGGSRLKEVSHGRKSTNDHHWLQSVGR